MVISNTIKHDFDIVIHNQTIARVKQDRFLGVIIDEKLTFNAHKTALARKISNNCGVLYRARYVLNQKSLVCLYYSFRLVLYIGFPRTYILSYFAITSRRFDCFVQIYP